MPIEMNCDCGKQWSINDGQGGQAVTCPACRKPTMAPKRQPEVYEFADDPAEPAVAEAQALKGMGYGPKAPCTGLKQVPAGPAAGVVA